MRKTLNLPSETHLGKECVSTIGESQLLHHLLLGLVSSVKCPGQAILQAFDLARGLREAGIGVVGGFHSPMEKECLELLLRGTQPLVICPARSLTANRIPRAWRPGIDAGRVLLVSAFPQSVRRATAATARERNRLVARLAHSVFLLHATPGGQTEQLARETVAAGKSVFTFAEPESPHLVAMGVRQVSLEEFIRMWTT